MRGCVSRRAPAVHGADVACDWPRSVAGTTPAPKLIDVTLPPDLPAKREELLDTLTACQIPERQVDHLRFRPPWEEPERGFQRIIIDVQPRAHDAYDEQFLSAWQGAVVGGEHLVGSSFDAFQPFSSRVRRHRHAVREIRDAVLADPDRIFVNPFLERLLRAGQCPSGPGSRRLDARADESTTGEP